ncbi:hypothetical protein SEVIR_4G216600v4 [Setaria viridis]|uniref:Uncharacterized protein n=2 Tax=Setaria TaxID=4554 RepID=K3XWW6_SETIT|nr:uncharacterized protein LOC101778259 [Setaria italica]XP_034590519.1 uncharacterized protein LOC117852519 [Setaria viridis]RCV22269.1 hypothetical protein SETIT_4G207300v2 [Setaria italica]TKW22243.1 hypothetical protein SEVIR_4G216600v2 [Setaria viridis]
MGRRPSASNAAAVASAEPLLPSALKRGVMERCASRPDDELHWFRSCLRWVCMDHSGPCQSALSWLLFLALSVVVPAAAHFLLAFRASRRPISAVVQLSLSAASAAGFLCLSSSFRRIGLRRLLYLDKLRTKSDRVRFHYTARLAFSFRLLASLVAPCFVAEAAYKAWWYATSADRVPFFANDVLSDVLACSLEMASWMYRSAVYLLTCVLFRLICHLQGLRLEDFAGSLLEDVEEGRTGVASVLREHLDIRRQLKVISHRFRKFIVAALLITTASQFASVLLTTRRDSVDNLLTTGELALCSVVLMSGLIIILNSAAKITHQAQALTGHTTKWHACCTIAPVQDEEGEPGSNQNSMIEQDPSSDSDTESDEYTGDDEDLLENTKIHLPHAHVISFQKRQALVTYLENNRAGITVFGFTLDRSYLHTIFMLEWTLFLWLLGKTIGFS